MQETLDPSGTARAHGTSAPRSDSRGFSLVELLAALMLTVITIMGLAHTLSLGNGFIDRYGTARAALARANWQLEEVRAQVKDGQSVAPIDSVNAIVIVPGVPGTIRTHVQGVDDPVNGTDASAPFDYFQVSSIVTWRQGGVTDSIAVNGLLIP